MTGNCPGRPRGTVDLVLDGAGGAQKGFKLGDHSMLREPLSLPTQDAVPEGTGQGPLCTPRAISPAHWH